MILESAALRRPTLGRDDISLSPAPSPLDESRPEVASRVVRGFDPSQLRESLGPGRIEHRLLRPGHFDAHVLRITTAKLTLQILRYSLPVSLIGTWPQGCVVLVFGYEMPGWAVAQGQRFPSGAIAALDESTGIDACLCGGATCAILVVDRLLFSSAVLGCEVAAPDRDVAFGTPLCVRDLEARRLRGLLKAVLDDAELAGQLVRTPAFSVALERDLLRAFARAFATAEACCGRGLGVLERRSRLVKKAEAYVLARLDQSVRMEELCREVGASARALEYAFQSIYGMGVMRYLRTIRLNEVRKALLHSDASSSATVTSTAMEWGFWHLGEFAAAYRHLFGEAPSETLRMAASRMMARAGSLSRMIERGGHWSCEA